MKHIRILLASLALLGGLMGALVPVATTQAASPKAAACQALGSGPNCNGGSNGVSITHVVRVVINILSWIVGVASVIMIIVGGFKYVTSGGDSNSISSAKDTILYALIGVAIAAMAQFIVQFVLKNTLKS